MLADTVFRKGHKAFRQVIALAPPTRSQRAEEQMRAELYLEAVATVEASVRVGFLRNAVNAIIKGQVALPFSSRWVRDPAVWNFER